MKVRAISIGYYNNKRVREGEIFELPEKLLKKADDAYAKKHGVKAGSPILPKWVELASLPPRPEKTLPGLPGGKSAESESGDAEGDDKNVL